MAKNKYTEAELYDLLWNKAEKIEKIPGAREINSDPNLPDYQVFIDCFGEFRKSDKLKLLVKVFQELNKKNTCFCYDSCYCDPAQCDKNVVECKAKLDEFDILTYFVLFDTITFWSLLQPLFVKGLPFLIKSFFAF